MGMPIQGLMTTSIITTVTALKTPKVTKLNMNANIESTTDKSFEKRVRMRPIGFESTNSIWAFAIFSAMVLWIAVAVCDML